MIAIQCKVTITLLFKIISSKIQENVFFVAPSTNFQKSVTDQMVSVTVTDQSIYSYSYRPINLQLQTKWCRLINILGLL